MDFSGEYLHGSTLLEVSGLGVRAGGRALLEGVGFSVCAGGCLGLAGPSGCGKTMLLRVLAGLEDPGGGLIRFLGKPAGHGGWPAFRRQVVLVAQKPALVAGTVRENLARPFAYATVKRSFPEREAAEMLERFSVGGERLAQDAASLSVGQQQRVCLVRALLLRPAVLLLDEPTSALDVEAVASVEGLIAQEAEDRGMGAVIVSHDPAQLARWCGGLVDVAQYVSGRAGHG